MFVVFFCALDELGVQHSLAGLFDAFDEHSNGRCTMLIFGFTVALAAQ